MEIKANIALDWCSVVDSWVLTIKLPQFCCVFENCYTFKKPAFFNDLIVVAALPGSVTVTLTYGRPFLVAKQGVLKVTTCDPQGTIINNKGVLCFIPSNHSVNFYLN